MLSVKAINDIFSFLLRNISCDRKFFPFRVYSFPEGRQKYFERVTAPESALTLFTTSIIDITNNSIYFSHFFTETDVMGRKFSLLEYSLSQKGDKTIFKELSLLKVYYFSLSLAMLNKKNQIT